MRVLLALGLVLAAGASAQPEPVVLALDDGTGDGPAYRFDPVLVEARPGGEVLVRNEGQDVHTFTHDADPRLFHVPVLEPGASEAVTAPDAPGEYPFVCVFHGGMRGTLRVAEADAPAPASPTPLAPWLALAALAGAAALVRVRR